MLKISFIICKTSVLIEYGYVFFKEMMSQKKYSYEDEDYLLWSGILYE